MCSWKLDLIREDIHQLQQSFDAILRRNDGPMPLQHDHTEPNVTNESKAAETTVPVMSPYAQTPTSVHHARQVQSPSAQGSTPQVVENLGMAMTRENSPDTSAVEDQTQDSVSVTEPMGSLYEVTRLRNIRSNQAKTARPNTSDRDALDDFITREVHFQKKELFAFCC